VRVVIAQGARFIIGLGAMVLLSRVPPARLRIWTPIVFASRSRCCRWCFAFGSGRSARLWINLGVFYLQPGELLKISVPMMVAWYLHRVPLAAALGHHDRVRADHRRAGRPDHPAARPRHRHAGRRFRRVHAVPRRLRVVAHRRVRAGRSQCAAGRLAVPQALPEGPHHDVPQSGGRSLGAGWNIIQSKIAIGSGGLLGKGWGNGSQSHLDFLPEHTTDFAFSVLSEEWGWVGVSILFALYLFIVGRSLWIAANARDGYSRLLAGALAMTFSVYVLVNGSMVVGLLPVVGVPMPLLSYGGTSAVSLLAGFGIIMSVRAHRKFMS
jgi:rod shape determining protein RodA